MQAGKVLNQADMDLIEKRAARGLYAGADWDHAKPVHSATAPDPFVSEPAQEYPPHDDLRPININELKPGLVLEHDLYDAENVLLLTAPNVITARFIRLLKQFGTTYVCVKGLADAPLSSIFRKRDTKPDQTTDDVLDESQLWLTAKDLLDDHLQASNLIQDLSMTVNGGGQASVKPARKLVEDFYAHIGRDPDLLLAVTALQKTLGEYLFDHAVNVAMISMSLGSRVGIGEGVLQEMGIAALFQDIGMLNIPDGLRLAPRRLTRNEIRTVQQHPLFSYRSMKSISSVPSMVPAIALQVHERLDGSGYPRGLSGAQIALPSRVVAIADAYCAMTRPRPHRAALLPHEAMRELLEAGHAGQLDRQILRSFLDMQSVYGVGTIVELSDGRQMRVARANPQVHTRPLLLPIDDKQGQALVNLADHKDLKITKIVSGDKPD